MVLSDTWFMEGYIDYELQKYRLLAYLQDVKKNFSATRLYPQLAEVIAHYNNLLSYRANKQLLKDAFPKRLANIAPERMELVYEQLISDNSLIQELDEIISFAIGGMRETITEGAAIYELIEKQMTIEPVGIVPIYKNEGYALMHCTGNTDVNVYHYTVSIFDNKDARYRALRMQHIDTRTKTLANTWEQMKIDIVRDIRTLPNPAVYVVELPLHVPFYETLLPITKRTLVRYL
jgi:hypothetical protein